MTLTAKVHLDKISSNLDQHKSSSKQVQSILVVKYFWVIGDTS